MRSIISNICSIIRRLKEHSFLFPWSGWQVINQWSLVAVVNRDQDAVSIMTLDSESAGAEAPVNEFLNQEGITTLGKSNAESNGLAAYRAEATGQTEDGTQIKFYLYAIEYDGSIYRFLNYTTAEKYGTYASRFNEITSGFGKLTDSGILNIQPVRIQAIKTSRSGTFWYFLPANLESFSITVTPEDLAIMNQVGLGEQISSGTWLKLPNQ